MSDPGRPGAQAGNLGAHAFEVGGRPLQAPDLRVELHLSRVERGAWIRAGANQAALAVDALLRDVAPDDDAAEQPKRDRLVPATHVDVVEERTARGARRVDRKQRGELAVRLAGGRHRGVLVGHDERVDQRSENRRQRRLIAVVGGDHLAEARPASGWRAKRLDALELGPHACEGRDVLLQVAERLLRTSELPGRLRRAFGLERLLLQELAPRTHRRQRRRRDRGGAPGLLGRPARVLGGARVRRFQGRREVLGSGDRLLSVGELGRELRPKRGGRVQEGPAFDLRLLRGFGDRSSVLDSLLRELYAVLRVRSLQPQLAEGALARKAPVLR